MEVAVISWPADAGELSALRADGVPRLLRVAPGVSPPDVADCLEDWVAPGATDDEVAARRATLKARAEQHGTAPSIDGDGLLHFRGRWVSLSPVEQRLALQLVERFGAVVGRDAMARRAWPSDVPTRNALDVHILRLRRRIAPLGLEVRTVRSRGYVLQRTA